MTKDDLNCLIVPAMFYALRRGTHGFVVDTVTQTIMRNVKNIRADLRYKMVEIIDNALDADDDKKMDFHVWERVMKVLGESIDD